MFTDDEGDPLPIEAARNTYRRLVGSRLAEGNPTKIADAKERCRKLLQADRVLQGEWELTTVLLTLRPRPLDDHGRLITPTLVADAVRTARDAYPFADSLRYQLKGRRDEPLNYEYATVMAGTEHWATPHLHAYLWVDDGDNVLSGETLAPVLSQLIEDCPHARPQDHFIHEGAEVGAVTIQHDPDLATNSEYGGDKYEDRPVTRGAKYLATQLPHFAMKGAMDGPDPPDYEIDAAVTAWSLGGDHVTTSGGIKQTTDVLVG